MFMAAALVLCVGMVCGLIAFILLLRVRVEDTRRAELIAEQRYREATNRTHADASNRMLLEKAQYEYAIKQLAFAENVLRQVNLGRFDKHNLDDLIAACTRQLNGVPPPHNARPLYTRTPGTLDLEVHRF